ncbi:MAG: biotin--[acetyl-CoA-carboxylase] ligase [Planctomycetota bacterium]|nr:MAG: biotin--[acetyl-CoA-carboxylase] ligase [Planctomycetota bacterium]
MRIEFIMRCVSTNTVAREWLAAGGSGIYAVVAAEQTAARGRRNRFWASPAYGGVWMSVAFARVTPKPLQTLAAGVAAYQTAKQFAPNAPIAIRWPNDLTTADNRKLCGILCEACPQGLIVGVGFNLHTSLLPAGLNAVGLDEWLQTEDVPDRRLHRDVAETLVRSVCKWIMRLEDEGADAIIDAANEWMWRGTVRLETEEGVFVGQTLGVEENGELVVDVGGEKKHFLVADVRLLRLQKPIGGT